MGHSRNTLNYDLPLFDDRDKPTWRGDFNGAMEKIDAQVGALDLQIATVGGNIDGKADLSEVYTRDTIDTLLSDKPSENQVVLKAGHDVAMSTLIDDPDSQARESVVNALASSTEFAGLSAQADAATSSAAAATTAVQGLQQDFEAQQQIVPTIDDLGLSWFIPCTGTTPTALLTTNTTISLWTAHTACRVNWASLIFDYFTLAANDVDYWTIELTRYRDGVAAPIISKSTRLPASGGEAITARRNWNYAGNAFDPNNSLFQQGDNLMIRTAKTGAPAGIQLPGSLSIKYVPQ